MQTDTVPWEQERSWIESPGIGTGQQKNQGCRELRAGERLSFLSTISLALRHSCLLDKAEVANQ